MASRDKKTCIFWGAALNLKTLEIEHAPLCYMVKSKVRTTFSWSPHDAKSGIRSSSFCNNELWITIWNMLCNTPDLFLCSKSKNAVWQEVSRPGKNFIIQFEKMPQSTGLKQECWSKWPVQKPPPCHWAAWQLAWTQPMLIGLTDRSSHTRAPTSGVVSPSMCEQKSTQVLISYVIIFPSLPPRVLKWLKILLLFACHLSPLCS